MGSNQLAANSMNPMGNQQGMGGNTMFGSNPTSQTQSTGLFGTNTSNTNSFGGISMNNQGGFGMGGNTGVMVGQGGAVGGTLGVPYDKSLTKKSNENCWVQSINAMQSYKDKVFTYSLKKKKHINFIFNRTYKNYDLTITNRSVRDVCPMI